MITTINDILNSYIFQKLYLGTVACIRKLFKELVVNASGDNGFYDSFT